MTSINTSNNFNTLLNSNNVESLKQHKKRNKIIGTSAALIGTGIATSSLLQGKGNLFTTILGVLGLGIGLEKYSQNKQIDEKIKQLDTNV